MSSSEITEAKARLDKARTAVVQSEQEMQMLKRKIRELGEDDKDPNSLELVVLKVEGLPDEARSIFTLQLSSPIEESTISKVFDPNEPTAKDSLAIFSGVETSNATLTVSAKDVDVPLGVSEPIDVSSLTSIADLTQPEYVIETPIKIFPEGEGETDPICTATFKVTYKPSAKDQREELYDLLNKASEKKNKAIGELNEAAKLVTRSNPPATSSAVQRGFLNKSSGKNSKLTKKEKSGILRLWEKYLGPQSWVRHTFPVVKNYIIFFGVVTLFHYKGQELALPPPV
mmetsp:Transcript_8229/g.11954  ORF Transcript_8229/g.11954 Transcript_8229/m.11954 type:complete len:286 (-) Transcript_8229:1760-2617(-)